MELQQASKNILAFNSDESNWYEDDSHLRDDLAMEAQSRLLQSAHRDDHDYIVQLSYEWSDAILSLRGRTI